MESLDQFIVLPLGHIFSPFPEPAFHFNGRVISGLTLMTAQGGQLDIKGIGDIETILEVGTVLSWPAPKKGAQF